MALRGNYMVANNNHSEAMPFLQSFRQTKFDVQEEHLPEIDSKVTSNDIYGSSHEDFISKNIVDTNANVDIVADHRSTEKKVTLLPKKAEPNHKIDYDNMYFTDEEIPVMGYTSGDENSSIQLLESQERKIDQPVHKLMPLPKVGAMKSDFLSPLVINDCPSKSATSLDPSEGAMDCRLSDYASDLSPSADDKSESMGSSNINSDLDGRYSRFCMNGGFSESSSKSTKSHERTESTATPSMISFTSSKAQLVSNRAGENCSELVNHSLDSGYREHGLTCKESESSNDSLSDSDEAENLRLIQSVPSSALHGECYVTKTAGLCDKFVVDADEPIHMTLEEVRSSLRNLNGYLQSGTQSVPSTASSSESARLHQQKIHKLRGRRMHFGLCLKPRHVGLETTQRSFWSCQDPDQSNGSENTWVSSKSLKHTLCNWFGIAKCGQSSFLARQPSAAEIHSSEQIDGCSGATITNRALPPVPSRVKESDDEDDHLEVIVQPDCEQDQECDDNGLASPSKGSAKDAISDFASSIQKVKDCGWYWGPISGEMAEKILSNEPDGSFILRDSSDEYYIFSLTFKLNGFVRHVRIEHEQGNFSFGTFTKFKSHTIVEFIENAVQHSRSGRYLFFIHRRPVLGPMRVQLLHPVSRFKQVQSLQHTCRFTILKVVRRDLIENLPIPKRLKDYLNTPHYYTEQMQDYQSIFTSGSGAQSSPPERGNTNIEA